VNLIDFTYDAAIRYSQLRAIQKTKAADAMHLACAAEEGIDLFITNDKDLVGTTVPGIQYVVGLDTNLY